MTPNNHDDMRRVILRQNYRIQELEDRLMFWVPFGIAMTAACIVVAAIKCSL